MWLIFTCLFVCLFVCREQEEQSLKAALEMSKTDCNGDQETEGDGEADAGGEASGGEASGGGDLLLDFSNTGGCGLVNNGCI